MFYSYNLCDEYDLGNIIIQGKCWHMTSEWFRQLIRPRWISLCFRTGQSELESATVPFCYLRSSILDL